MKNATVVLGGKWGDEGKGKVASRVSKDAKLVIRATGGANAGHTTIYNGKTLALHLVPGGIVYPKTKGLIGQGVVLDPIVLLQEISFLQNLGLELNDRLKISGRAHVVFPYHKDLDELYERMKDEPVGTTKRGIGPCYADKANRVGIRVYDLLLPTEKLAKKIEVAVRAHNQLFKLYNMDSSVVNPEALAEEYSEYGKKLQNMVVDADHLVSEYCKQGDKIVVEGAQAYRLDLDNGDYPNVTSSNCATNGTLNGAHLNPKYVKEVIVCVKAHDSRVGNGPFPTEQPAHIKDDKVVPHTTPYVGDIIREKAHEYGTTTKRPRRVGWFDAPMLRSAKWVLGADCLCVNHIDTMGKIGEILGEVKICTSYIYQGKTIDFYPDDMELTGEIPTPVYTTIKGGWDIPSGLRDYGKLPDRAKAFLEIIEEVSGIPIKYVGVGPANDDLIELF